MTRKGSDDSSPSCGSVCDPTISGGSRHVRSDWLDDSNEPWAQIRRSATHPARVFSSGRCDPLANHDVEVHPLRTVWRDLARLTITGSNGIAIVCRLQFAANRDLGPAVTGSPTRPPTHKGTSPMNASSQPDRLAHRNRPPSRPRAGKETTRCGPRPRQSDRRSFYMIPESWCDRHHVGTAVLIAPTPPRSNRC